MYYLMNKDTKIAKFHIDGFGNEQIGVIIEFYENEGQSLPWYINDFTDWLKSRTCGDERENISLYKAKMGLDRLDTLIRYNHCMSLHDTLWVNTTDQFLNWDDVKYYGQILNQAIHTPILETLNFGYIGTLPELSTPGQTPKIWIGKNDGKQYMVRGKSPKLIDGTYSIAVELMASPIFEALCGGVAYRPEDINGQIYSMCERFTDEDYGLESTMFTNKHGQDLDKEMKGVHDYYYNDIIRRFIVASCITVNAYDNTDLLLHVDNNSSEIVGPAKPHDYTKCLFPEISGMCTVNKFDNVVNACYNDGLDRHHFAAAMEVMTPEIKQDLINLRGIKLECPIDSISKEWVDVRTAFVNEYINVLLNGRRDFVFHDTKKSSVSSLLAKAEGSR